MYRIGGRLGSECFGICGAAVGIPPLRFGILTCAFESSRGTLLGGQFDWGGRLQKSNGGVQRLAQPGRKSVRKSANAKASLTARLTGRAVTKVGVSDPVVCEWKCHRSTDKSYPGDNRLISPKSPHRRGGLAPRCRLIASWGCIRSQGFGCSPIKAVRELGSERRETVRSLSVVGAGYLKELSLVREDRDGRTSGAPVVTPVAQLGSYVRIG